MLLSKMLGPFAFPQPCPFCSSIRTDFPRAGRPRFGLPTPSVNMWLVEWNDCSEKRVWYWRGIFEATSFCSLLLHAQSTPCGGALLHRVGASLLVPNWPNCSQQRETAGLWSRSRDARRFFRSTAWRFFCIILLVCLACRTGVHFANAVLRACQVQPFLVTIHI